MNEEIVQITKDNFIMYRSFIISCIEFTRDNFKAPLETSNIKSFEDLVLYCQTDILYIPSKNNKMLGFFGLNFYEFTDSLSISYFTHPVVCKLSIISLIDIAITQALIEAKHSNVEYLVTSFSHPLLQRNFMKRFKEVKTFKLLEGLIFITVKLDKRNLQTDVNE